MNSRMLILRLAYVFVCVALSMLAISASMADTTAVTVETSWQSSALQLDEPVYAVAVQGDYAYLGVGKRMMVVDVSNPLRPVSLGETESLAKGWCDFRYSENVHDIVVSGNYAYVAAGSGGLYIIDVSDPWHPMIARRYDLSVAVAVAMEGSTLAVGTNVCDDLAGDVHVFRISDATDLIRIGDPVRNSGFDHAPGGSKITVARNYIYATIERERSIFIVSGYDPSAYVTFTWGQDIPYNVTSSALHLFVQWQEKGRIFEIKNPIRPYAVNWFDCVKAGVDVDGDRLYSMGDSEEEHGLPICVYDISEQQIWPQKLSTHYVSSGVGKDIAAQDGCAYVGTDEPGAFYVLCSAVMIPTITLTPSGRLVYFPLMLRRE